MKLHTLLAGIMVFMLGGCVSDYAEPWVEKADALVGRNLRTEREMVVVESYDRMLLVLKDGSERFTRPSEHQRVVADIPIGSRIAVKKRTFRVSKPGRDDYLVVDIAAPGSAYADVLLIIGSIYLADGNFSEE